MKSRAGVMTKKVIRFLGQENELPQDNPGSASAFRCSKMLVSAPERSFLDHSDTISNCVQLAYHMAACADANAYGYGYVHAVQNLEAAGPLGSLLGTPDSLVDGRRLAAHTSRTSTHFRSLVSIFGHSGLKCG